jgi:Protein of unknown function (DUF4199)
MKKTVLTFGLISGGILAGMMAITLPLTFCGNGVLSFEHSELLGYTSMFLAFLLVFFGIRSYRENASGGTITFGRAFKVGLLITLITCAMYVITWEIVYYGFIPDFAEKYAAHTIADMQKSGATAAAIAETKQKMADFAVWYRNPLLNIGMTFLEVFPVGLIMTLISAAILRRKPELAM